MFLDIFVYGVEYDMLKSYLNDKYLGGIIYESWNLQLGCSCVTGVLVGLVDHKG